MATSPLIDQFKNAMLSRAALAPPPIPGGMAPMVPLALPNLPHPGASPVISQTMNAQAPATLMQNTLGRTAMDQSKLRYMDASGSGAHQIDHPVDPNTGMPTGAPVSGLRRFGGVLARIGDTALSIVAPGVAALTPGTDLHHRLLMNQQTGMVNNDLGEAQKQAAIQQTQALTDYTQQRPEIEQSRIDQKQTAVQERVGQAAAARGQNVSWDENGLPSFEDDMTSQAYADHQALSAMHQATSDKTAIMADIAKNHYIPGTPEFDEAQRKLGQVDKRMQTAVQAMGLRAASLDLRRQNTEAGLYGTVGGVALPGSMIDDAGQTVGTKFQQNVRPTGLERSKADMAASASTQIADMKAIALRHPEMFGPGYGQATAFKQWLGTQSPDAQRFIAARTIAGDHLAGTFGGRSEAALNALDTALGQFKDNPKAAIAGLDQLSGANEAFRKAGTVRSTGSNAAAGTGGKADYVFVPGKGLVKQ